METNAGLRRRSDVEIIEDIVGLIRSHRYWDKTRTDAIVVELMPIIRKGEINSRSSMIKWLSKHLNTISRNKPKKNQKIIIELAKVWKQVNNDYRKDFAEFLEAQNNDEEFEQTYEEEQDEAHYRGQLSGIELAAGRLGFTSSDLFEAVNKL